MADPGFYGSYPYGQSRYSQNKSTFFASSWTIGPVNFTGRVYRIQRFACSFTLGPLSFTGNVKRIQRFASAFTLGPLTFTGNVKRIQRIASSYTVGPVNFTGRLYPARGLKGNMSFSMTVTGNLSAIWRIAGSMGAAFSMSGDLFVELFWKQITEPSDGNWEDTIPVDAEWTPIDTPPVWN